MLIVLEGIDGTGKSTQAQLLAQHYRSLGRTVTLSREPTDGPWGKKVRESAQTGRLSPQDELQYFLNDRQQHLTETILPALANNHIVILDRYYFSTMAYQGARGFDPNEIRRQNETFAPVPDLLLILDIDIETALQRIGSRGDTANQFEQRAALTRCRQIFLTLANEPFAAIIPANQTTEKVTQNILQTLKHRGL